MQSQVKKWIHLAFLFHSTVAVYTSEYAALPQQIIAVHESMLTKRPLCYVLAFDRGAGKTIIADLV